MFLNRKKVFGIPANAEENNTENNTVEPQEVWVETNYDINNFLTETGKYVKEMLSREAPLTPITIPDTNETNTTNTTENIVNGVDANSTSNVINSVNTENAVNSVESDLFKQLQDLLNQ